MNAYSFSFSASADLTQELCETMQDKGRYLPMPLLEKGLQWVKLFLQSVKLSLLLLS